MKSRLFVDMDGTLAVFRKYITDLETLYKEGYFADLLPNEYVVRAIRLIQDKHPEIEVFICSSYLSDSKYALNEKNEWLDRHLPQIDKAHRIFMPCGQNKSEHIPGGVKEGDYLLDDLSDNVHDWKKAGGTGIKLFNGINGTHGTWKGEAVSYSDAPEKIVKDLLAIICQNRKIIAQNPINDFVPPMPELLRQYNGSLRSGDMQSMVRAGNVLFMKYGSVMPEPLTPREMKLLRVKEDPRGCLSAKYLINQIPSTLTISKEYQNISGHGEVLARLTPSMREKIRNDVINCFYYSKQKEQIRNLTTGEELAVHEPDFTGLTEEQIKFVNRFMDTRRESILRKEAEKEK